MPIAPDTLAAFKKLAAETAKLDQRIKKLDTEVAKRKTKVTEAIAANDSTLLDIQLAALKGDLNELGTLLRDTNALLSDLETLKNDDDFMRERDDDAATVGGIIAKVRTGVAKHVKTLKGLQNDSEEAWRKSIKSEDFALRMLAEAEKDIPELTKKVFDAFMKSISIAQRGGKAVQERDPKALSAAKAEMAKLGVASMKIEVDITGKVLADSEKSIGIREVTKDTLATLKDGYADMKRELQRASETVDKLVKENARLEAMQIKTIEVKKALDALGLDGKAEGKLAKVLNGPPKDWVKGLEALARDFKTGSTGVKYLEILRGAGLVPK